MQIVGYIVTVSCPRLLACRDDGVLLGRKCRHGWRVHPWQEVGGMARSEHSLLQRGSLQQQKVVRRASVCLGHRSQHFTKRKMFQVPKRLRSRTVSQCLFGPWQHPSSVLCQGLRGGGFFKLCYLPVIRNTLNQL